MTNQPTPSGYFNATEKLNKVKQTKQVKVSQFLDNAKIACILNTLDEPQLSAKGRYGYTFLRNELLPEYEKWLSTIGESKTSKAVVYTTLSATEEQVADYNYEFKIS